MEKRPLSRRDVLKKAVPAAALAGVSLGALDALAQQQAPAPGGPTETAPPSPAQQGRAGNVVERIMSRSFRDGQYQLPPLPYAADALEPHISAEILQIHHDRHHQSYVNNLNKTISEIAQLRQGGQMNESHLNGLQRDLSFNGGGHVLHTLFWEVMAPPQGQSNTPQGEVAQAIEQNFGSFDQFKSYFTTVAVAVRGSGWALMVYDPISDGLGVFQVGDHDMRVVPGALPILTVDVWEHAYYLQYQNKRADFVNAWWNVVNWPAVNDLFVFYRQRNRATGTNMQA